MQHKFTVRWSGKLVALYLDGEHLTSMHYKAALSAAQRLREQAANVNLHNQAARGLAGIREEKTVILTINGRAVTDMQPADAIKLANAITAQARQAESLAQVDRLIDDSALLIRAGAPFALTHNDAVFEEALKEAQSNRLLRRALPGEIRSTARAWPLGLRQHPPKGVRNYG